MRASGSTQVLSEEIQHVELIDADGKPRRLADAWATRPAVIAFLRHFG